MTKRQMARMISMLLISVLLILSVGGYATELVKVMQPAGYVDNVNIDGADFTTVMNVFIFGVDSFIGVILGFVYCIAIFVIALVLLLPWCLIAIRRKSLIDPMEMKVVKITFVCVPVLCLLLGFIGAKFSCFLATLGMTLVVTTMFGLLCFLPYILADIRCRKTEMTYES